MGNFVNIRNYIPDILQCQSALRVQDSHIHQNILPLERYLLDEMGYPERTCRLVALTSFQHVGEVLDCVWIVLVRPQEVHEVLAVNPDTFLVIIGEWDEDIQFSPSVEDGLSAPDVARDCQGNLFGCFGSHGSLLVTAFSSS